MVMAYWPPLASSCRGGYAGPLGVFAMIGGRSMQPKVFDLEGALKRFDGDEELFHDMVQFFMQDVPGLLDQVRQGVRAGAADAVELSAHSLKGLAANFGAKPAIDIAYRMELLGTAAK